MSATIRLKREASFAGQAGCATTIGLFLTVLGAVIMFLMRSDEPRAGQNEWLVYVVGGGFALVGLVVAILGVKMFLASRLPETIVEVNRMPVRAGEPFRVTVRQPGPIRLESLRLNLIGEQLTQREVLRDGKRRTDIDRRLIHQKNVLDLENITILSGEEIARDGEAIVPAEVSLADIDGDKRVVWRLEVWGRVRGWVDFGHPFVLDVFGDPHNSASPNAPEIRSA
jgi:hypothetical protein